MASNYLRGKTWWVQYYQGGKRINRSLKTKDKAVARFRTNEIEIELARGLSPLPSSRVSSIEALAKYSAHSRNYKSERTVRNDDAYLKHFIEVSGCRIVQAITIPAVRSYLNGRIDRGEITRSTANHVIAYLKTFMSFCVLQKYIPENPLADLKKYPVDKKPPAWLTVDEVDRIMEAARGESIYSAVALGVYAGLRRSEIFRFNSLTDIVDNTIIVRRAKSKKFRVIPLHSRLREILSNHPVDVTNQRRILARICRKAGVRFGWHTLRHTFASRLVQNGVSIYKVSQYLGHSAVTTTQIYAHLTPEDDRDIERI